MDPRAIPRKMLVLPGGRTSIPFCDVARHGHTSAPELAGKPEDFFLGKVGGEAIDCHTPLYSSLPDHKVPERVPHLPLLIASIKAQDSCLLIPDPRALIPAFRSF